MKWNWGTGIVVGMGIFMIFILQYVVRVQVDKDYDNELVTENYYQEEINIDNNYQAEQNALILGNQFTIEKSSEGVVISFPETMDVQNINGKISLYRPSDQSLDQTIDISLSSSNYLLIPLHQLAGGRWDISVHFQYEGKQYLKKSTILI